ncbi:hypothetical protein Ancab_015881 [Ancistrocladus abbreviatus]
MVETNFEPGSMNQAILVLRISSSMLYRKITKQRMALLQALYGSLFVIALSRNELQFEVNTFAAGEDPNSHISHGLNFHQSTAMDVDASSLDSNMLELMETVLLKKLKDDLNRLPDDEGFNQFAEVSIEGLGLALLFGYGWMEGRGIGGNAKEDAKVVQYKRRTTYAVFE